MAPVNVKPWDALWGIPDIVPSSLYNGSFGRWGIFRTGLAAAPAPPTAPEKSDPASGRVSLFIEHFSPIFNPPLGRPGGGRAGGVGWGLFLFFSQSLFSKYGCPWETVLSYALRVFDYITPARTHAHERSPRLAVHHDDDAWSFDASAPPTSLLEAHEKGGGGVNYVEFFYPCAPGTVAENGSVQLTLSSILPPSLHSTAVILDAFVRRVEISSASVAAAPSSFVPVRRVAGTGATAIAHSAATVSADREKEGDDVSEGVSGVGQGQNTEGDRVRILKATTTTARKSRMTGAAPVGAGYKQRQRLASAAPAVLAGMQPVAYFSVSRNNGTPSLQLREEQAGGHGHARVAGLPNANSNPTAPANPVTSFFGPGNTRRGSCRTIIDNYENTVLSESCGSTPNGRATIRSFLSAVGMSAAEALADDGAGYAAALDEDIEAHRDVRAQAGGNAGGALPDRIQALEVRDRRARTRTSPSRSTRDASAARFEFGCACK
ncbi:hypothetical protein DFH11DRAFT_1725784 [Phellopilus nigrolimitatus]|nr:hypothetical protein DFH11DRAFT_1725784 [Phellopilus nigrolimitatus]